MGSKTNPGKFDCLAKAKPDEPMFHLLGRDRHGSALTMFWAILRHAEGEDRDVTAEAEQCSAAMAEWCKALGKEPMDAVAAMMCLLRKLTQMVGSRVKNNAADEAEAAAYQRYLEASKEFLASLHSLGR